MTGPRAHVSQTTQRWLAARFEVTIPLRKPVIVTHTDVQGVTVLTATGLPAAARREMIYIKTKPGRLVAIPICCVLDIKALYSEKALIPMKPQFQPDIATRLDELAQLVADPKADMIALVRWWQDTSQDPALLSLNGGVETRTAISTGEIVTVNQAGIVFRFGTSGMRTIGASEIIELRIIPRTEFTSRSMLDLEPHGV